MKRSKDFKDTYSSKYGIFLHNNLGIHFLIVLMFNLIISVTLVGIFEQSKYPIFDFKIAGFIFYIIITTLLETMLTIFLLRHFLKFIFKTKGVIIYITYALIFYISTFLVEGVNFKENVLIKLLVYTFLFLILRIFFVIIYQRYIFRNKKKEN